jgi:Na+-translocating ferredoxin:NAD+ oxidoreductase RnfE subunit
MNDAEKTISPKVIASAVTSILLVAIIAGIGAITPELFAGLGAWAPVVYASVVSIGGALAAFIKRDPLRG